MVTVVTTNLCLSLPDSPVDQEQTENKIFKNFSKLLFPFMYLTSNFGANIYNLNRMGWCYGSCPTVKLKCNSSSSLSVDVMTEIVRN